MRQNDLFVSYKLGTLIAHKEIYAKAFPLKKEKLEKDFKLQTQAIWQQLDLQGAKEDEEILKELAEKGKDYEKSYKLGKYSYILFSTTRKEDVFYKVKTLLKDLGLSEDLAGQFFAMDASLKERILFYTTHVRIGLERKEAR